MSTVTDNLPRVRHVDVSATAPPRLLVVVDTEEEFDWAAPPSRTHTSVVAMRRISRAQEVFDRFGLRPTYVIDYPVAVPEPGTLLLVGGGVAAVLLRRLRRRR